MSPVCTSPRSQWSAAVPRTIQITLHYLRTHEHRPRLPGVSESFSVSRSTILHRCWSRQHHEPNLTCNGIGRRRMRTGLVSSCRNLTERHSQDVSSGPRQVFIEWRGAAEYCLQLRQVELHYRALANTATIAHQMRQGHAVVLN